jgi:hypothetical protein
MGRYLCLGYQGKFFWRDSFLIPASRFQNSQGCPGAGRRSRTKSGGHFEMGPGEMQFNLRR